MIFGPILGDILHPKILAKICGHGIACLAAVGVLCSSVIGEVWEGVRLAQKSIKYRPNRGIFSYAGVL